MDYNLYHNNLNYHYMNNMLMKNHLTQMTMDINCMYSLLRIGDFSDNKLIQTNCKPLKQKGNQLSFLLLQ